MSEIHDLHEPLMRFLRQEGIPFIRARSDQRSTIQKGWPDFTLLASNRPALLLELKLDKQKLSKDQVFCHAELAKTGLHVHVVRSYEAVLELIQAWRENRELAPINGNRSKLRQHKGYVWQHDHNGYNRIRPMRAEDAALPQLFGGK